MKKASIVVHPFYNNNKLFDLSDSKVNRDNCLYSYHLLKEQMADMGFNLATSDIHSMQESDLVIYNEAPDQLPEGHQADKSMLLLFETELIRPQNWNLQQHKDFRWVMTWNDEFIDDKHYFKMNFSHLFPQSIERVPFEARKFCTLIAGNKMVSHPLELYSARLEAIRWFEKNHPDLFDYYGMGWDQRNWGHPFLNKVARKLNIHKILPAPQSPCYRGPVDNKKETLKNYKFSICYENAEKIPGYITEKIFDSFFAGCIPVYWGAPNITDHIPKECFVDKRDFPSMESLFDHLNQMDAKQFNSKLDAIEAFLQSPSSRPFTSAYFAETIAKHVKIHN